MSKVDTTPFEWDYPIDETKSTQIKENLNKSNDTLSVSNNEDEISIVSIDPKASTNLEIYSLAKKYKETSNYELKGKILDNTGFSIRLNNDNALDVLNGLNQKSISELAAIFYKSIVAKNNDVSPEQKYIINEDLDNVIAEISFDENNNNRGY